MKNIHCSEGGVLLINNREILKSANIICEIGTNRQEFLEGKVSDLLLYIPLKLVESMVYFQVKMNLQPGKVKNY